MKRRNIVTGFLSGEIILARGFFVVAGTVELCYNHFAADSFQQEGGEVLEQLTALFISIVASVIAYYICKWLDGDDE